MHVKFQEKIKQNMYENSKFKPDFPRYTEDNMQQAIKYSREIGIGETYNILSNIKCDQK